MPLFGKKSAPVVSDALSAMDLLHEAKLSDDPIYAHACLTRAEILAPDSLEVQRALLLLGRLHERGKKVGDYSVIKSYLLHPFEHPEKHPEEEQRRMARELFDEPRLKTCLSLTDKPDEFLQAYLLELAQQYMHLFVAGDSSHAPRLFGLSYKGSLHKYLARPASDMIHNVMSSPYLDAGEQVMLGKALYRAFYHQVDGQVKELDRLLGAQLCHALA